MSRRQLKKKAAALVAEAWAVYFKTRDPADERIAKAITEAAAKPTTQEVRKPRRLSREAEKRRIRQRSAAIDPTGSILAQVRNIVR